MQGSVGQLHLRLDPGDVCNSKPRGPLGAVAQKRRLSHARLTPDDEDRALTAADTLQEPVQCLNLSGPAPEPLRDATTRRARSLPDERFECPPSSHRCDLLTFGSSAPSPPCEGRVVRERPVRRRHCRPLPQTSMTSALRPPGVRSAAERGRRPGPCDHRPSVLHRRCQAFLGDVLSSEDTTQVWSNSPRGRRWAAGG